MYTSVEKVRVRAVVMNIAQAEMPSENMTNFLITLIENDNYFSPDLLWDSEVQQLEFSR